ncbi:MULTISPECIES: nitrate ABC transporter ATP-binding protein [Brevundimonas]|jgi:nitrate/nitrite transport system ATP-binding protein|uniref:ATP-binding cassette domain-containing protein n=1 Tax=Brevundimonas mediterranea TaxID=74329 RepID=A0AB37EAH6_9CAUL|nr:MULTISPECIES: nitrate ABC transporter ATP-binding protein [Brevundimonas]EDX79459.1 nitrate ABC transporter, ATP-binding proteins C and D, putative [Brevundimonas sp. BAL3]MBA4331587.1 nitrate/sulfonate/bicarbonate ABC transporter ATP-binding protein [Brevundimonas sp.]QIH74015.1 ATP-binding cassette domain-containing protein [Brevundimonas mediterranea]TAJ42833.1 MAG: ATP-binding cassette domain-containing protein [Brevundimonas sp.]
MSAPILSLRGLSKSYLGADGARTDVLSGVELDVQEGEFVAVLGFSGAGKTTLVSAIAGLIEADSGDILIKGRPCAGPGPDRGVVFQSYSLFPWLTVEQNVRLAVDAVHLTMPKTERVELVRATVALVGLAHALDRKPAQLSGGMRQRVAVARALATKPEILLLDEPLSALDALTRAKLQDEIERIRRQEKRTIVLVTNDVDEALLLADRVAVLTPAPHAHIGRIFEVALARPRDRTELNHDEAYKTLRNEIVGYLGRLAGGAREAAASNVIDLPTVAPLDLLAPPKAYQDAAYSPIHRRYLEFYNLSKVYPTPKGPLTVVEKVNLLMDRGEFISLIGHSGCGKSTVLTMAAGLNPISDGGIVLNGREIEIAGPDKAVVFQSPSLMPWLTARQNVALGVERVYPHATRAERADIVAYYLERVGLGDAMNKMAADMSNGMRQRVGIARAFALSPRLLLLDEPFGMLDSLTRWDLQDVLVEVWNRTKVTTVMVTHDVDEAILLADRVVMMTNGPNATIGKVLEVDLPRPRDRRALLDHPQFYAYREEVLQFLADYEHGAHADAA